MGMAFDLQLGEGDALGHGTATAPSAFDPIMLVIAAASGCLFVTLLISCVCCSRRRERQPRNAHLCSRRDTVPLEDLLSKPTLADPESFFSEAPLDDKDPPHAIGYWTSNDDTSVASMSQMSDLSTSELMSNDPGHTHASGLERKCKSEKVKRSKHFQNRMLNNELRSSAKENRRQSDHILDYTTQNNAKIIVNNTQMDKLREDDFLYKNNDFDYVNEINNTSSRRGNIDNKLKKTDNKDPSSMQRCLDVTTMTEDRVSSESFTSSARGSISHDMTASVNVLRLPRQSIIPQAESWSGSLLEESERSTLSELKEIPSPPINTPAVQFSISGKNASVDDGQSIQSTTKIPDNNTAIKSPQDPDEAIVEDENSSGPHSVEIRPPIQDTPTLRHPPESSQPAQSNCNNADQTSGRIPERISLNLQIDFHFSDKAGCCGNQTRSYVVCSPVSVSQEIQGVSSSRMGTITTPSNTGKQPFYDPQNSIPGNATCAIVQTDRSMSNELQPYTVTDNTNKHSISHSDVACEGTFSPCTRTLDVSRKRFSTPIDFITARGMNDIGLQRIEKRRFTVSDVADIEVVLKERTLVQMPRSENVQHPPSNGKIDMDFEKKSLSYVTNDQQSRPSEILAPNQTSFAPSNTEPNQGQHKSSNISSQESHPSNAINDSEQVQKQQANPKIPSQESHFQNMVDKNDPDQPQQECSNILSHELITGNDVGDGNQFKSDNQNKISGNTSLTRGPEAGVEGSSSKNDTVYVPNRENEISRLSNGENEGNDTEKPITVDNSISEEETKDRDTPPSNIETDTRTEEKQSSLTPLNASIQEDDEDIVIQSEEEPVTIGNSTKKEEIHSNKTEQTDGHGNFMPLVNNEEPVQENENDKYLSDKRPQCSVKDTPVDGTKTEKTGKNEEILQSRQHIQEKEKGAERYDYTCKDGARICSTDTGISIPESDERKDNLKEEENHVKTSEYTERHDYTCKDGARICDIDGGSVILENEGQNYASEGENRGKTSEDVEVKGDVVGTEKDKMTGSENTNGFDTCRIISNKNDKTSYKVKLSCGENERTHETNNQTADDTKIKVAHGTVAADCKRNISTCNQLVENDSLNTKTKSPVGETKNRECLVRGHVPQLNSKPAQEQEDTPEKQRRSQEICKTQVGNESKQAKSHETEMRIVSKPVQKDIRENASNTLPTRLRDQNVFDCDDHKDPSDNTKVEEKPQLKGILRVNRSFDMTFKEQDNLNMDFYPIHNKLGSTPDKGQSEFDRHQNVAPFVFVSNDLDVDRPALSVKTESEERLLSPTLSLPKTEDKSNASDESDYDNPWDSLDEAVKRGSMRYNRRASRVADDSDAKTLMLKSAEDLGRLLEDAERRRRIRQNAARSSCQITDTTPPSPPPTFTRLSPFRHTVKGLVSHGSSTDLKDDTLKSHPIKGKKDRQRSKDDLSHGFKGGIDPNRSKTITAGERSKIYSPETKKRKGLLHRK